MTSRRQFLRIAGVTVGLGAAPAWLARAAEQGNPRRKILISIFQRGAADGLNIVVPFFEKQYYKLRPSIAIAAPGTGAVALPSEPAGIAASAAASGVVINTASLLGNAAPSIDLDGRFSLHPQLQPLKPLWDNGPAGNRACSWLARLVEIAFRRAGFHGVGHGQRQDGGWLAQPRAAGIR